MVTHAVGALPGALSGVRSADAGDLDLHGVDVPGTRALADVLEAGPLVGAHEQRGPPSVHENPEEVMGSPPRDLATLTDPFAPFWVEHHTAPSPSMQMPSTPCSSGAQTRRLDRLPSASMSHAASRKAMDSATMSVEPSAPTAIPFGERHALGDETGARPGSRGR